MDPRREVSQTQSRSGADAARVVRSSNNSGAAKPRSSLGLGDGAAAHSDDDNGSDLLGATANSAVFNNGSAKPHQQQQQLRGGLGLGLAGGAGGLGLGSAVGFGGTPAISGLGLGSGGVGSIPPYQQQQQQTAAGAGARSLVSSTAAHSNAANGSAMNTLYTPHQPSPSPSAATAGGGLGLGLGAGIGLGLGLGGAVGFGADLQQQTPRDQPASLGLGARGRTGSAVGSVVSAANTQTSASAGGGGGTASVANSRTRLFGGGFQPSGLSSLNSSGGGGAVGGGGMGGRYGVGAGGSGFDLYGGSADTNSAVVGAAAGAAGPVADLPPGLGGGLVSNKRSENLASRGTARGGGTNAISVGTTASSSSSARDRDRKGLRTAAAGIDLRAAAAPLGAWGSSVLKAIALLLGGYKDAATEDRFAARLALDAWSVPCVTVTFILYLSFSLAVIASIDELAPRFWWLLVAVIAYDLIAIPVAVAQFAMVRAAKREYREWLHTVASGGGVGGGGGEEDGGGVGLMGVAPSSSEGKSGGMSYAFLLCRLPFDRDRARRLEALTFFSSLLAVSVHFACAVVLHRVAAFSSAAEPVMVGYLIAPVVLVCLAARLRFNRLCIFAAISMGVGYAVGHIPFSPTDGAEDPSAAYAAYRAGGGYSGVPEGGSLAFALAKEHLVFSIVAIVGALLIAGAKEDAAREHLRRMNAVDQSLRTLQHYTRATRRLLGDVTPLPTLSRLLRGAPVHDTAREASTVCVDFCGAIDGLIAKHRCPLLGAERLFSIVRALEEEAARFDVAVASATGDGFWGTCGLADASLAAQHSLQTARFAIAVAAWHPFRGVGIRVGCHSGPMASTILGHSLDVVGAGANISAEVAAATAPGTILATDAFIICLSKQVGPFITHHVGATSGFWRIQLRCTRLPMRVGRIDASLLAGGSISPLLGLHGGPQSAEAFVESFFDSQVNPSLTVGFQAVHMLRLTRRRPFLLSREMGLTDGYFSSLRGAAGVGGGLRARDQRERRDRSGKGQPLTAGGRMAGPSAVAEGIVGSAHSPSSMGVRLQHPQYGGKQQQQHQLSPVKDDPSSPMGGFGGSSPQSPAPLLGLSAVGGRGHHQFSSATAGGLVAYSPDTVVLGGGVGGNSGTQLFGGLSVGASISSPNRNVNGNSSSGAFGFGDGGGMSYGLAGAAVDFVASSGGGGGGGGPSSAEVARDTAILLFYSLRFTRLLSALLVVAAAMVTLVLILQSDSSQPPAGVALLCVGVLIGALGAVLSAATIATAEGSDGTSGGAEAAATGTSSQSSTNRNTHNNQNVGSADDAASDPNPADGQTLKQQQQSQRQQQRSTTPISHMRATVVTTLLFAVSVISILVGTVLCTEITLMRGNVSHLAVLFALLWPSLSGLRLRFWSALTSVLAVVVAVAVLIYPFVDRVNIEQRLRELAENANGGDVIFGDDELDGNFSTVVARSMMGSSAAAAEAAAALLFSAASAVVEGSGRHFIDAAANDTFSSPNTTVEQPTSFATSYGAEPTMPRGLPEHGGGPAAPLALLVLCLMVPAAVSIWIEHYCALRLLFSEAQCMVFLIKVAERSRGVLHSLLCLLVPAHMVPWALRPYFLEAISRPIVAMDSRTLLISREEAVPIADLAEAAERRQREQQHSRFGGKTNVEGKEGADASSSGDTDGGGSSASDSDGSDLIMGGPPPGIGIGLAIGIIAEKNGGLPAPAVATPNQSFGDVPIEMKPIGMDGGAEEGPSEKRSRKSKMKKRNGQQKDAEDGAIMVAPLRPPPFPAFTYRRAVVVCLFLNDNMAAQQVLATDLFFHISKVHAWLCAGLASCPHLTAVRLSGDLITIAALGDLAAAETAREERAVRRRAADGNNSSKQRRLGGGGNKEGGLTTAAPKGPPSVDSHRRVSDVISNAAVAAGRRRGSGGRRVSGDEEELVALAAPGIGMDNGSSPHAIIAVPTLDAAAAFGPPIPIPPPATAQLLPLPAPHNGALHVDAGGAAVVPSSPQQDEEEAANAHVHVESNSSLPFQFPQQLSQHGDGVAGGGIAVGSGSALRLGNSGAEGDRRSAPVGQGAGDGSSDGYSSEGGSDGSLHSSDDFSENGNSDDDDVDGGSPPATTIDGGDGAPLLSSVSALRRRRRRRRREGRPPMAIKDAFSRACPVTFGDASLHAAVLEALYIADTKRAGRGGGGGQRGGASVIVNDPSSPKKIGDGAKDDGSGGVSPSVANSSQPSVEGGAASDGSASAPPAVVSLALSSASSPAATASSSSSQQQQSAPFARGFSVRTGLHIGAAAGTMIGTGRISFEVFGPAMATAVRTARAAPRDRPLASAAFVAAYEAAVAEERRRLWAEVAMAEAADYLLASSYASSVAAADAAVHAAAAASSPYSPPHSPLAPPPHHFNASANRKDVGEAAGATAMSSPRGDTPSGASAAVANPLASLASHTTAPSLPLMLTPSALRPPTAITVNGGGAAADNDDDDDGEEVPEEPALAAPAVLPRSNSAAALAALMAARSGNVSNSSVSLAHLSGLGVSALGFSHAAAGSGDHHRDHAHLAHNGVAHSGDFGGGRPVAESPPEEVAEQQTAPLAPRPQMMASSEATAIAAFLGGIGYTDTAAATLQSSVATAAAGGSGVGRVSPFAEAQQRFEAVLDAKGEGEGNFSGGGPAAGAGEAFADRPPSSSQAAVRPNANATALAASFPSANHRHLHHHRLRALARLQRTDLSRFYPIAAEWGSAVVLQQSASALAPREPLMGNELLSAVPLAAAVAVAAAAQQQHNAYEVGGGGAAVGGVCGPAGRALNH